MPFGLGFFAAAGAGGAANSFELIQTVNLASPTQDVFFDSIPQTFRHLQIRMLVRNSGTIGGVIRLRPNYDTGFNYWTHSLSGSGSSAPSSGNQDNTGRLNASMPLSNNAANYFGAVITDIPDYTNTSKFKTLRSYSACADVNGPANNELNSILWRNTGAINGFWINSWDGNFAANCRFSLYGIRG